MLQEVNKILDVRLVNALKNKKDEPIKFEVLEDREDATKQFVPDVNDSYVFPLEETLDVLIGLDGRMKTPVYIWGMHGSGKSSLAEQLCARTNRPCIRVQHSIDTEASDVYGQWLLEGDKTVFNLGPLARAMRDGLVYIADEYDFALPNVLAVYQAVLEGHPLFIKSAPEHMAIIKPHKDFRFIATGNTNGSGDETGLYQGTQMQNAANYSRFGITVKLDYQSEETEKKIINNYCGEIPTADMEMLMNFVRKVREAYSEKTITNTLSTREVIQISKLAIVKGRETINWRYGIQRGFAARMSSIDAGAISNIVDKIFGE